MEGIVITEVRARVISQEKGLYKIFYEGQENWAEVSGKYRYETTTVSDFPAVGDYVLASWPKDGSRSIITNLFPRKSVFIRKAAGTDNQEQVVASNIDTVFLCMSLNNDFNIRRLERYVASSWDSGANPVVVLTKTDLCENIEAKILEVQGIARGVDVITVSSKNNDFDAVNIPLKENLPYCLLAQLALVVFIGRLPRQNTYTANGQTPPTACPMRSCVSSGVSIFALVPKHTLIFGIIHFYIACRNNKNRFFLYGKRQRFGNTRRFTAKCFCRKLNGCTG